MNDEGMKKSENKKISTASVALICVSALLIVAVICCTLIYLSSSKQNAQEPSGISQNIPAKETADIEQEAEVEQEVAEGMFQMSMNTIWTFPSGDKPSSQAYVANAKNNTKPIKLEVSIDETGEVVFTSPVIPVGTELESLVLDTPLEKGDYPATCKYILLNEDGSENSTFSVAVTISIAR